MNFQRSKLKRATLIKKHEIDPWESGAPVLRVLFFTVLDSSNFIAKTWTDLTHVNQWIGKSILND